MYKYFRKISIVSSLDALIEPVMIDSMKFRKMFKKITN